MRREESRKGVMSEGKFALVSKLMRDREDARVRGR